MPRARALTRRAVGRAFGGWPAEVRSPWTPEPGQLIAWGDLSDAAGADHLWRLEWRRPHDDPGLRRRTEVLVAREGDRGWVTLREWVVSHDGALRAPPVEEPRASGLVTDLVEHLHVGDGGWQLTVAPRRIDADGVLELDAFVRGGRALPVVVIAPDDGGHVRADADGIARTLVGLAHVVVLAPGARRALAEELGPRHVPAAGGVRLLWARWRSADDPSRHPAWRAEDAASADGPRPGFTSVLARLVFEAAALRVPDPPLVERLEAAAVRRRITDLAARVDAPEPARLAPEELAAWEDDLRENERLRHRVADLDAENERLRADKDRLLLAWTDGAPTAPADVQAEPARLVDVVRQARDELEHLVVLDEAVDAAARWQFDRTDKVWQALVTLDEIAGRWAAGALTGTFAEEARHCGLDWAPAVSESARQKYAADYLRTYDGRTVQLGPHLRLRGPRQLLRIYLVLDREHGVVVVGHVGEHLRDGTTGG